MAVEVPKEHILADGDLLEAHRTIGSSDVYVLGLPREPIARERGVLTTGFNYFVHGNYDFRISVASVPKFREHESRSADFFKAYAIKTKRGIILMFDLEDALTSVDTASWNAFTQSSAFYETHHSVKSQHYPSLREPEYPDVFFTEVADAFYNSPEELVWLENTIAMVDATLEATYPQSAIPNHPYPHLQILNQTLVRDYVTAKNKHRSRVLQPAKQYAVSKDFLNAIFSVQSVIMPLETLSEVPQDQPLAVAVCRSLADTVQGYALQTNGERIAALYATDANSFVDALAQQIIEMFGELGERFIKSELYKKIGEIYAAWNLSGEVNYALTESESVSHHTRLKKFESFGATDGGIFPGRNHRGNLAQLFQANLQLLTQAPNELMRTLVNAADDATIFLSTTERRTPVNAFRASVT